MEERAEERLVFTVTDLKQYAYCPRIVYYTYCLPLIRPTTYKMESGARAHTEAKAQEQRRTLAAYGLVEGIRHFNVHVASERLGLQGRIDLVIEVGTKEAPEWIPVDYKQSARRAGPHYRQQLAAYGMMLEETAGGAARYGFIYSLMTRKAEKIALTERLRNDVWEAVTAMREMVKWERMPEPPRSRGPCINCEFRRFCNDVL